MLKEYKSMTQEEMYTLVHEIYIEGCMENAREKYPDVTDLTTAIQQEEDSFVCFLQDFFTLPENTYYVLEKDNMPVSAARLSKINDFYYLEALETPPQYRKKVNPCIRCCLTVSGLFHHRTKIYFSSGDPGIAFCPLHRLCALVKHFS